MKPRFVCAFALLAGCVIPMAPESTTGQPATAEPAAVAAGGLTCMEAYECIAACADDACVQSCQASPSAAPKLDAMITCLTPCQNGAACPEEQCQPEVMACVLDGGVATGPPESPTAEQPTSTDLPGQPHSNEGLLEWMTGDWIGTNHQFEFHADGTVRRSSGVALYHDNGNYGCLSLVNDIGAVRQEGDLLIMTFESSDTNHCGDESSAAPVIARYRIEWYDNYYDDDPYLQLMLRDLDCVGGDMWCVDGMRRR